MTPFLFSLMSIYLNMYLLIIYLYYYTSVGASLVAQVLRICLQCGRPGFDLWVGKICGGGHGNPLQYLAWRIPMDRGAWRATVHGVAKSQT